MPARPPRLLRAVTGTAALLLGLAASAAAAAPAAERAAPERTLRLERAVIVDAAGQARPVAAATLFVPHGWRSQGGVEWGPQYACTSYLGLNWSASSPDGQSRIAWLPAGSWEQNNTGNPTPTRPGCTMQPFTDARGYLQAAVPLLFRGARVLDYQPRRDLMRLPQPVTRPGPGGMQVTQSSDAGQVVFAFQQGGVEMRGVLIVGVHFEFSQAPTPGIGVLKMLYATTDALFAATAPRDRFDLATLEALRASFQPDPAWLQAVTQHVQQLSRIQLDGVIERQRIARGAAQQVSALIQQSWQAGQRSGDQRALAFSQSLRGVQSYRDADGKTTELSSGFAGAWRLDDGSYLLAREPGFDPWRDAGLRGQKLDAAR